jgi:hypothetical protein
MSAPTPSPTETCVVCREAIEHGAAKCTHCSSYQNWSRHLFRWSGVVGAIAALYPLFKIAAALQEIATPHKPDLRFAALSCETGKVSVALANVGKSDGVLSGAVFRVDGRSEIEGAVRTLVDARTRAQERLVIKPDQVMIVDYVGLVGDIEAPFPRRASSAEDCSFKLTFSTVAFDTPDRSLLGRIFGRFHRERRDTHGTSEVSCPCPD